MRCNASSQELSLLTDSVACRDGRIRGSPGSLAAAPPVGADAKKKSALCELVHTMSTIIR